MRSFFIAFFFISNAYASPFVIALGESQLRFHPLIKSYIEDVILDIYGQIGVKAELLIVPTARMRTLQEGGKVDAIGGSFPGEIDQNYSGVMIPIVEHTQLNLYRKRKSPGHELRVGYVAGEYGINPYIEKVKNDKGIKLQAAKNSKTLYTMLKTDRVNAIVMSNYTAKMNFSEKELSELVSSKVATTSVSHYITKKKPDVLRKFNLIASELDKKGHFKFVDYLRDKNIQIKESIRSSLIK